MLAFIAGVLVGAWFGAIIRPYIVRAIELVKAKVSNRA